MTDGTRPALGLSIGATTLAAVTADRAVTRKPVLTLYGQRAPEVGVPSENPNLDQPGVVITDFMDRLGDPGDIVAADGSRHRSQELAADALRALAHVATGGQPVPQAVAVSYPAHWQAAAVDALRAALIGVPELSHDGQQVTLVDDAAAAVIALTANPGLPNRGIVAVCDFGGSGTSLTLVDAANGYRPVAPTVRHTGFSGDMIDQALLNHVVTELSDAGSFDTSSTSAIGTLTRLRGDCRRAKELLSSSTATTVTADLPGFRGDVQLTRAELEVAIRGPLEAFVAILRDNLQHNEIREIRAEDLAAVATVGGCASIPAVTTTLSENLRVPVVTAPRPHLTAAIGAALRAASAPVDDASTALAPTAEAVSALADPTMVAEAVPDTGGEPPLAWSEAADDSDGIPLWTGEYPDEPGDAGATGIRPQSFDQYAAPAAVDQGSVPWYRQTGVLILATALAVLALVAAVLIALRHTSGGTPTTPTPSVSTSPGSSAPSQPSDTNQPPSSTPSDTSQPASSAQSTTPPSSSTETSSSTQSTTTQPSTSQPTTQAPPSSPVQPNRPVFPFPRAPRGPQPEGPGGG